MAEAVTDAQWAGARALLEGNAPTHSRVAAAMGIHVTTLSHRAAEMGWKGLNFRLKLVRKAHATMIDIATRAAAGLPLDEPEPEADPNDIPEGDGLDLDVPSQKLADMMEDVANEDPDERVARISGMIAAQADRLLRRAAANGSTPDRRQIMTLIALTQLAERIATQARSHAVTREIKSDEEVAAVLRRIDNRIIYLAKGHALQILRQRGVSEDELRDLEAEVKAAQKMAEASAAA